MIILSTQIVYAHFLFLETDSTPKIIPTTQKVKIYFGHPDTKEFYEGEHLLPMIEKVNLYKPDGKIEKLKLMEEADGLTCEVKIKQKGIYIIVAKRTPSVYNPAWKGKPGFAILSEAYAKVMVWTGGVQKYDRTIGRGAEIIPLINPFYLKTGDVLKSKFLYNGKPMKGYYRAAHESENIHDENIAQIGEIAEDGTFSINITKPGAWFITAASHFDKPGKWTATFTHKRKWFTKGDEIKYDKKSFEAILTIYVPKK